MIIHVIRGQDQIGGSIIEISSGRTRLILEAGSELGEQEPKIPEIDGLFFGEPAYHALFISHYHGDHIGLADRILPGIPIYMGEKSSAVYRAAADYLGKTPLQTDGFLRSGETITVDDIRITPFLCDHSAFDSYMLLLECEGRRILYTGDFRANGRKSFSALLARPGHADVLITEGTALSRENKANITETELEMIAGDAMSEIQGPTFIFMASTNIDRCVSSYKAARHAGRLFMQDVYTASIASAAGDNIPNPGTFQKVRVFLTSSAEKQRRILKRSGL